MKKEQFRRLSLSLAEKQEDCKTRKKLDPFYRLLLVKPLWIITSALAGYTSVAARSRRLLLGVFTTLLWRWPADHRVMASPSPESLKRPFQLETDFIFWPLALRCLVAEAAAEPMERRAEGEERGQRRGGDGEVEVGAAARKERGLPRTTAAPLLCCCCCCLCCPQRKRFREKLLVLLVEEKAREERRRSGDDDEERARAARDDEGDRQAAATADVAADLPAPHAAAPAALLLLLLLLLPLPPSLASAESAEATLNPRICDLVRERTRCQLPREEKRREFERVIEISIDFRPRPPSSFPGRGKGRRAREGAFFLFFRKMPMPCERKPRRPSNNSRERNKTLPRHKRNTIILSSLFFFFHSQEIVRRPPRRVGLAPPRRRLKLQEARPEPLPDLHDRREVAAPVAVVGRAEHGHDRLVVAPVVALHHELVRARDEREAVGVVELLRDVGAKGVPGLSDFFLFLFFFFEREREREEREKRKKKGQSELVEKSGG